MTRQTEAELRAIRAEKQVNRLLTMIQTIIHKHPYTAAMFEEELKTVKQKEYGNNQATSANVEVHSNHGVQ